MVLVMVGTALLGALERTYQLSAVREREAQARALAEAGITEAVAVLPGAERTLAASGTAEVHRQGEVAGSPFDYTIRKAAADAYVVRAVGAVGSGPDGVRVTLVADVARGAGSGKLAVVRVVRE
jgi:hypothetical protein